MSARLFCKYGRMKGASYPLKGDMLIGRATTNQIVLAHKLVSSRHARIYYDGEKKAWFLQDLESLNGTKLDGAGLTEPERLGHVHLINFGGSADFFFMDSHGAAVQLPTPPQVDQGEDDPDRQTLAGIALLPVPPKLGDLAPGTVTQSRITREPPKPPPIPKILAQKLPDNQAPAPVITPTPKQKEKDKQLVLKVTTPNGILDFALSKGEQIIGREAEADIHIPHDEISRRHAVITLSQGLVHLQDLRSTNHSYKDGEMIDEKVEIKPGTKLAFGKIEAILEMREM